MAMCVVLAEQRRAHWEVTAFSLRFEGTRKVAM
jgi:hypothetical protein